MMPMPQAPEQEEAQEAGPMAAMQAAMAQMKECMAKMEAAMQQMHPDAGKSMAKGFAKARPMGGAGY